jgi:DNA-binding NarL/FixJ family response regulator
VVGANAYRGRSLLFLGRISSARRQLVDAAVAIRDDPKIAEPSWCLALAAEAHALLGHHEEARSAAREAATFDRSEIRAFRPDELRALAWVDAQGGHISSAIEQLWVATNLASSQGQRSFEIIILEDLLRLGELRAAERTREVAAHIDGAWSAAVDAHAAAILSGQTADLEMAADAFGAMGSSLVAAELWSAVSAAYQREGLLARAAQAARKSAALAQLCEGARTDAMNLTRTPDPLSRRERETAKLAASGATNAQIAAELSVSVRTVESHLYGAFAKLGITDRKQLLHALQEE